MDSNGGKRPGTFSSERASEAGRRSGQSRAKTRAKLAASHETDTEDLDVRALSRERLVGMILNRSTPARELNVAIRTVLDERLDAEAADDWKLSVQVRPGWEPVTWPELIAAAREFGAA